MMTSSRFFPECLWATFFWVVFFWACLFWLFLLNAFCMMRSFDSSPYPPYSLTTLNIYTFIKKPFLIVFFGKKNQFNLSQNPICNLIALINKI